MEKELILIDLQKQLHESDNPEVKMMLNNIISNILTNKYNVRIWD
jgi:hypothetical protein